MPIRVFKHAQDMNLAHLKKHMAESSDHIVMSDVGIYTYEELCELHERQHNKIDSSGDFNHIHLRPRSSHEQSELVASLFEDLFEPREDIAWEDMPENQ